MHFLIKCRPGGAHTYLSVYVAKSPDRTPAKCGELIMRVDEAAEFLSMLNLSAADGLASVSVEVQPKT